MALSNIRVWANPYAAFDHIGRPCSAVLRDPGLDIAYADKEAHHADPSKRRWEPRQYVGAVIDQDKTSAGSQSEGLQLPSSNVDTVFKFSDEAIEVPSTPYYRERVRDGELFAADENTAKLLGVTFVEQTKAYAEAKKTLAAKWRAHYPDADVPEWAVPPVALVRSKKEVA